ncbi:MAG: peptidase S24 [Bacteroidales bacterium]|jgi:SOS-response transcriptional repressor LexA|nr:peptidase S24 [Bacteroidales bacterium]
MAENNDNLFDLQRIRKIINWYIFREYGKNDAEIASLLGYTKSSLSQILNGQVPVSQKFVDKLCSIDDNINKVWINGKGDMLLRNIGVPKMFPAQPNEGIPLIPISAMAGFGTGETQILEYECERFVVPTFKEAEFLIQVKGSSMYPKYNSGDIVACRKLPLDTFFQWNKVYALDTEQGALVKRIKKGETDDTLTIVSDNPNYEPFILHRSKIYAIAIVVGVIRQES